MFRLTVKELVAKKLRLLTTGIAVLLGVAFLAGTLVLTDTIGRTLDGVIADSHAGTDAYVRSPSALSLGFGQGRAPFSADVLDAVLDTPGVAAAAPRVDGYAQVAGRDGKPVGDATQAPAFGLAWTDERSLNPYRISDGRGPRTDSEIVIDRGTARKGHLRVGDRVTVLTASSPRTMTITGIAKYGSADSPAGASAVLFTTSAAQQLLGTAGSYAGIAVHAESGVSQDELVTRLASRVPSKLEVITGDALTEEDQSSVAENVSIFSTFMLIFSLVAVFVAAFIINNTFSITVAQRTRSMAMLRALGASRRQVLRSVLGEATVVGALASVAGVFTGLGVATGLQALLRGFGLDIPASGTTLSARTVVVSLAVGIGVTLVSALSPARRAARVRPIEAMREVAVDRSAGSRRRLVAGGLTTGAGVALLVAGLGRGEPAFVGTGAAVVFLGVAALGPVLARPVTLALAAPLPRFRGIAGRLAGENAQRNPKRTARTAASLMIGVGLVAFISIFAASAKTSISDSVTRNYRGNYVLDTGAMDSTAGTSPNLAAELRRTPGVRLVSEVKATRAEVDGASAPQFSAFDATTIGALFDLGHVQGDVLRLGVDGIAVEAGHAADKGWTLGGTVQVTFSTGTKPFVVRALYDRSDEWLGKQFIDVRAFTANVPDRLDTRLYVLADDGTAVARIAQPYPMVDVLTSSAAADKANAEIDKMLGLIFVLLALAVVIALLGIANTLALSIHERTRELGLLRAVGMTRSQVRSSVRWEAVIIALFGTVLGMGVGSFFGWALVRALADQGITTLAFPVPTLAVVAAIAALAGVAAAVLPARSAARLRILDAIATA